MEMSDLKQCKFCVVTVKHDDLETRLHFTLYAKRLASYFKCEKCETHTRFWRLDTKKWSIENFQSKCMLTY